MAVAQAESITGLGLRRRPAPAPKEHAALLNGFSVHNGVHLHANDREGLAHLCGYGARPALSQERLSLQEDGRLVLRFRPQLNDGRTELTLAPTELLRRLAAMVPPPSAPGGSGARMRAGEMGARHRAGPASSGGERRALGLNSAGAVRPAGC